MCREDATDRIKTQATPEEENQAKGSAQLLTSGDLFQLEFYDN